MLANVKVTIHATPVIYKIAREEITAIFAQIFFRGLLWRKDDFLANFDFLACKLPPQYMPPRAAHLTRVAEIIVIKKDKNSIEINPSTG